MDIKELKAWRKKYKAVHGKSAMEMKQVARDFRDEFKLHHLKGAEIFTLLRDDWNAVIPMLDAV